MQRERHLITHRSSLFQLVAQWGHGSLHALILLPLALQHRSFSLNLLNDLIQHSAHSSGLLFLKLELCLTLCVRIEQLKTKPEEVLTLFNIKTDGSRKKDCRENTDLPPNLRSWRCPALLSDISDLTNVLKHLFFPVLFTSMTTGLPLFSLPLLLCCYLSWL